VTRRHWFGWIVLWLGVLDTARGQTPQYIGTATMAPDGTITLWLRADLPGGGHAHGTLVYPPDHPQYQAILDHIGGLKPGETKPVLPWPDPPPATDRH